MTALDAQVRATGLIAYQAVVCHAIENGLQAPSSIDLNDEYVKVWLSYSGAGKWVDSIHVDDTTRHDTAVEGREIVRVTGRTPLLGVRVQLRFSRPVAAAPLWAVQ